MHPPCPGCRNPMVELRLDHGDHFHPWFICLCGADVILYHFYIPKEF